MNVFQKRRDLMHSCQLEESGQDFDQGLPIPDLSAAVSSDSSQAPQILKIAGERIMPFNNHLLSPSF